jgi:hypothetical protein
VSAVRSHSFDSSRVLVSCWNILFLLRFVIPFLHVVTSTFQATSRPASPSSTTSKEQHQACCMPVQWRWPPPSYLPFNPHNHSFPPLFSRLNRLKSSRDLPLTDGVQVPAATQALAVIDILTGADGTTRGAEKIAKLRRNTRMFREGLKMMVSSAPL